MVEKICKERVGTRDEIMDEYGEYHTKVRGMIDIRGKLQKKTSTKAEKKTKKST